MPRSGARRDEDTNCSGRSHFVQVVSSKAPAFVGFSTEGDSDLGRALIKVHPDVLELVFSDAGRLRCDARAGRTAKADQ